MLDDARHPFCLRYPHAATAPVLQRSRGNLFISNPFLDGTGLYYYSRVGIHARFLSL